MSVKLNQGSWELLALATQVRSPSMAAGEKGSKLVTVFDGQDGIFCDFLFYFGESSFLSSQHPVRFAALVVELTGLDGLDPFP